MPPLFSVWNLIVCKNFMKSIPYEITESAKVDGANDIRIFYSLILPLVKPLLATIGMFIALTYWNDWYSTCKLISSRKRFCHFFDTLNNMLLQVFMRFGM